MIWTFSILQFTLCNKTFTANAVIPRVLSEVDLPPFVDDLKDRLDDSLMILISRSNEIVVGDVQARP